MNDWTQELPTTAGIYWTWREDWDWGVVLRRVDNSARGMIDFHSGMVLVKRQPAIWWKPAERPSPPTPGQEPAPVTFDSIRPDYGEIKFMGHTISLSKLTGHKIADVVVSTTTEFGDPTLQIHEIYLDNGMRFDAEGEHDLPYLTVGYEKGRPHDIPNVDYATLRRLDKEMFIANGYELDDDEEDE